MNIIKYKPLLILGIIILVFLTACSDDDTVVEPPKTGDPELYGTWEMVKITTTILGQEVNLDPADYGISNVTTFNSDLTLSAVTNDGEEVQTDTGTWFTVDNVLTITVEGEDPVSGPYSVNGDTAVIEGEISLPDQGQFYGKLEYKKQN